MRIQLTHTLFVCRQFVSYSCKLSSIGMESWDSSDPTRRLVSACPAERPRPATEMDLSARAMMIKLHCSSHIGLGGGAFLFYLNQQCHHADHLLPLHQQVEPEIHRSSRAEADGLPSHKTRALRRRQPRDYSSYSSCRIVMQMPPRVNPAVLRPCVIDSWELMVYQKGEMIDI
jgi:hypothetical protein